MLIVSSVLQFVANLLMTRTTERLHLEDMPNANLFLDLESDIQLVLNAKFSRAKFY